MLFSYLLYISMSRFYLKKSPFRTLWGLNVQCLMCLWPNLGPCFTFSRTPRYNSFPRQKNDPTNAQSPYSNIFLLKYVITKICSWSVSEFDWITFLLFECNFEKRHPFYCFSDCSKLSRIFNNFSVNLIFSFLIRWISSSWAIFIWRWFSSSSSKDFWIWWRLSRCRAAASRFLLRLRFRCSSLKVWNRVRSKVLTQNWIVWIEMKVVWSSILNDINPSHFPWNSNYKVTVHWLEMKYRLKSIIKLYWSCV